jgi:tetratricopeptide (TPR) repeat protein
MERDNFYIILDLSVDPPQTDFTKIEEAIKKKQTEWSRLRNHPTKGIKAQQYIGIIPEIRNVMMNPKLREIEARAALEIIRKNEESRFSNIDRHLELLMNKGFIKEEEIFKLAKHHKVNVIEIRNRIKLKEQKKFSGLDKQILNRMKKGYITEAEITILSRIHDMDEKIIRKRITCPIKNEKTPLLKKANLLDPSIYSVIEDNLKIIGKSSLYDFLEISPDSELEDLLQRAKDKELEVLKFRKKDAIATASGVLVGHCISLFKNEKNKASYDATRAQAHLSELNVDISIAAIEGIVRADNFEFLVDRAVEFGMNPEEASDYIKKYCKNRNWKIETVTKNHNNTKRFFVLVTAILIFLSTGAYYGFYSYKNYKYKNDYNNIIAIAESQEKLEDKIAILRNYLSSHTKNPFTQQIQDRYEEYEKQKLLSEYDEILKVADNLIHQNNLDKALDVYRQYHDKIPNSPQKTEITNKISRLYEIIEDKDFKALETNLKLETTERIAAYRKYLEKYPEGKQYQNVLMLLSELGDAYYITLKDELTQCEKEKAFEKCIRLADTFITFYPEDNRSDELKEIQKHYRQRLREEMVLAELRKKSQEKGSDYEAAKQIFINYLNLNPNSPLKSSIQDELRQLDKKFQNAKMSALLERNIGLLKATGGRFVVRKENIVTDTHTNLMWTMWDSTYSDTSCMDYETAHQYVSGLRTGGYSDWRIPAPKELVRLYKTEPFFPLSNAEWYWTSLNFKSYRDGWIQMVDVITVENNKDYQRKQIDSRRCGAVRAVRP